MKGFFFCFSFLDFMMNKLTRPQRGKLENIFLGVRWTTGDKYLFRVTM